MSSAILFAACSSDAVVSPMKVPTGPKLAMSAGDATGAYVVLLKPNTGSEFISAVAGLGGTVTYLNSKVGFATVAGLSADGVATLSGVSGVADIQADEVVSLDSPVPFAIDDAGSVGSPSAESQANPAGALRFARQWNMRAISAPTAWAAGKLGNASVKVAILDTGIDYDSQDSNGLVDAGNSHSFMDVYVRAATHADSVLTPAQVAARADNVVAANFFASRSNFTDFNGHGTNVATQVSSKATYYSGVTSKTTLLAVKVLGSNGSGSVGTVLSGVLWAADHGADVANMSLGGAFSKSGNGRFVGIVNKVFNYAKQQGMLIVVAAGNSGMDIQHNGNVYVDYCDAPHVLCVGALGLQSPTGNPDAPAFYTNFGKNAIGVAAPGGNAQFDANGHIVATGPWPWAVLDIASWVWSLCGKDVLAGFTSTNVPVKACSPGLFALRAIGTSQAAPHVAGLAASLIAQYGKGNPTLIKHMIQDSGDPMNPAFGGAFGRTRINVAHAFGL